MRRRNIADMERLTSDLAGLSGLDRSALVERWRILNDAEPPANISRPLLLRAAAYRMQEQILGGMKPASRRFLAKVFDDVATGRQVSMSSHNTTVKFSAKPGTRLLREWHGITYEVVVLEDGVTFRGKQYGSLSEVARVITGAKWSGPLFFGLKKKQANKPAVQMVVDEILAIQQTGPATGVLMELSVLQKEEVS